MSEGPFSGICRARPKSEMQRSQFLVTSRLAGLRSRWMTPADATQLKNPQKSMSLEFAGSSALSVEAPSFAMKMVIASRKWQK